MAVWVKFEIGHTSTLRAKQTQEGFTHDWKLHVRGVNSDISAFVEKVVFNLHDTFPKPKRVLKEPPYVIEESGYAGFIVNIDIYFRNRDEPKKVQYSYDLDLQTNGPPHHRCEEKKFLFEAPSEEFRHKLLKGGGVSVVPVPTINNKLACNSALPNSKHGSGNSEEKLSKGITEATSGSNKKHKSRSDDSKSHKLASLFGTTKNESPKDSPDNKNSNSHKINNSSTENISSIFNSTNTGNNGSSSSSKTKEKTAIISGQNIEKTKEKIDKRDKHKLSPHKDGTRMLDNKKDSKVERDEKRRDKEEKVKKEKSKDKDKERDRARSREKNAALNNPMGTGSNSGQKRPAVSPKTLSPPRATPTPPVQATSQGVSVNNRHDEKTKSDISDFKQKDSREKHSTSSSSGKKSKKEKKDKDKDRDRDRDKKDDHKDKHRSSVGEACEGKDSGNTPVLANTTNVNNTKKADKTESKNDATGKTKTIGEKSAEKDSLSSAISSANVASHADNERKASTSTSTATNLSSAPNEKDKKSHKHKKKDKSKEKDREKDRNDVKDQREKEKLRDKNKEKAIDEKTNDKGSKSAASLENIKKIDSSKLRAVSPLISRTISPKATPPTSAANIAASLPEGNISSSVGSGPLTSKTGVSSGSAGIAAAVKGSSNKKSQNKDKKSKDSKSSSKDEKRQRNDTSIQGVNESKAKQTKTSKDHVPTPKPITSGNNMDLSDQDSHLSTNSNSKTAVSSEAAPTMHSDSSNSSFPDLNNLSKTSANQYNNAVKPAATNLEQKSSPLPMNNNLSATTTSTTNTGVSKESRMNSNGKSYDKAEKPQKEERKRRRNSTLPINSALNTAATANTTFLEPPLKQMKKDQSKSARENKKSPSSKKSNNVNAIATATQNAKIETSSNGLMSEMLVNNNNNNASPNFLPPPSNALQTIATTSAAAVTATATATAVSASTANNTQAHSISQIFQQPTSPSDSTHTITSPHTSTPTPEYLSELQELHHKIMTLPDGDELQQVVEMIAATGCYEITQKTFDFDLCKLDRNTVQRLQEFLATTVS